MKFSMVTHLMLLNLVMDKNLIFLNQDGGRLMTGHVRSRHTQSDSAGDRTGTDGDRGAYWHHLTNTIEPSVFGGDAALCQITFSTCSSSYMH